MRVLCFAVILVTLLSCKDAEPHRVLQTETGDPDIHSGYSSSHDSIAKNGNGPLLLPWFKSMDEFEKVVQIQYIKGKPATALIGKKAEVRLTQRCRTGEVTSILRAGISQSDFAHVRKGTFWDRLFLGMRAPFAVIHKKALLSIEHMARRRPLTFGMGDLAFYHLAVSMVEHIAEEDRILMSTAELSEKGYLNTFNHITAQAFMTSIYSESVADYVADMHELYNLPQLPIGDFTAEQLADVNEGPLDNYLDMINNEWGQEVGKMLQQKYQINSKTVWTHELLADYLNDIQSYLSWSFGIGFDPFKSTDKTVIHFASKINFLKN